jgi:signal transduction histidine kinase
VNDKGPLGALVFAFNRTYEDLSKFEQESIESIVDVITIALDKSLLYGALRVANEKLRELDLAKSEFMSIASHQLRTPLAGIVGYLSMLGDGDYGKLDDSQAKVVKELYEASQRLVRLVNTFLNVTRIEAGRLTMNFTEVNLVEHVEAEVHELMPTAAKKKVILVWEKPKQSVITATADSDKIRDVFLNLVDNAIKYTPEGSVAVAIEQPDAATAHFTVHDTGVGIDPKDAASIFQKFVRGSGIARVQPNGSGLGLFIVKKIVEAHHGKVWMESEGPNKGSTFHVILPLQQPQSSDLPVSAAPDVAEQATTASATTVANGAK